MMARNGVADWRTVDRPTFDRSKRRGELETLVAPYVTTKNTGQIIAFKGKRRYVIDGLPSKMFAPLLALQALYGIEAAIRNGDIDRIVRATLVFADFDREIENVDLFKSHSVDALAFALGRRIEKPAAMRRRKAEQAEEKKLSNHARAEEAIKWARLRYTTAAADNKKDFLKGKAAEYLGINRSTLYRWLRTEKK